ncbi:ribonuclease PH [Alkalicoccobacillus porphyridii]|uniref:Ribonuclease PH n=1 Tax=Alkalicoccobacillus porphyridii TaxID=2597270 RepID=A0A554A2Q5_9BACI|nr:ribonuclease PH [Alkalicoccobacillus porphyridii]TSB47981.1 ribonuclease PH [Alkalicoccobacillus porphyridii]
MRKDGRLANEQRTVELDLHFTKHAEGSVLISVGDTKVICTATIEDRVPPFMRGKGKGWITAEYAMLPRATEQRNIRESSKGKVTGRTMEIQRLIGRALRTVVDLPKLGERTVWVDCDVIQADGGTRTAAITGAFIAMCLAFEKAMQKEQMVEWPVFDYLAAISVGMDSSKQVLLDLCYEEDASADVDMNVVMTGRGALVEVQGTGEEAVFTRAELSKMLDMAEIGIKELVTLQQQKLGATGVRIQDTKGDQQHGD